jgi:hypothetical protein
MEKYYHQTDWSGGQSDSDSFGGKGTYAEAVGIDIHSNPRFFQASQALVKSFGSPVALPSYSLKCSTGTTYFFCNDGTVAERKSDGSYGTVYKTSNGTICGCGEHNGYIYFASSGSMFRVSTSAGNWGAVEEGWGTIQTSYYHQMVKNGIYLFILNNDDIASIDDTTGGGTLVQNGTSDVTLTSLPDNLQYTTMTNFGIDLIVGTRDRAGIEQCKLFRWDTASPAWNSADDIPESMINGFITIDNYVLAQGGNAGRLYYYNGSTLEPFKKIKGDYKNKSMTMNPDSTCQFRGLGLFGVSNLSGNPCNQGVYTVGQYDRNYPMALNLDYVISHGSIKDIEIGTLCSAGTLLMVGWKAGTSYGIDEISWGTKYASAYVKTLAIGGNRFLQKEFKNYNIDYRTKPSGTDIGLEYDVNYGGSTGTITLDNNQTSYYKMSADSSLEAGVAQFKIKLTTSGNSSPEIEDFYTSFNQREVL